MSKQISSYVEFERFESAAGDSSTDGWSVIDAVRGAMPQKVPLRRRYQMQGDPEVFEIHPYSNTLIFHKR